MKETKIMSNGDIYECGRKLLVFPSDVVLPIKAGFYLRKNTKTILDLASEIDDARADILSKYGEKSEDGTKFSIRPGCVEDMNREVNELFQVTQTVDIYVIPVENFGTVELTAAQIDAISFMISEE